MIISFGILILFCFRAQEQHQPAQPLNPPALAATAPLVPKHTRCKHAQHITARHAQRESLAEGMRSPADIPNPDDSDDSDGYYFSDSDGPTCPSAAVSAVSAPGGGANSQAGGGRAMAVATAPVPQWSELETAVQALMGMEGGATGAEECEDGWDATESAR